MTKSFLVSAIVALVVSLGAVFFTGTEQSNLGGLSERDTNATTLKVGEGTRHDGIFSGTATCFGPNASLTSGQVSTTTCTVTGVKSGDTVYATLPAGANPALEVKNAFATTTNRIGVVLYNGSTTATAVVGNATASVPYIILSR